MNPPTVTLDPDTVEDPRFKEDAVREEVVYPLLVRLGYASSGDSQIVRSKVLSHPFVMIGTTKRPVTLIPDYVLMVSRQTAWVLDPKSPRETITSGKNVEQAFSYAIHPEIRARFFALCNGREIALFQVENRDPLLHFKMADLENKWRLVHSFLAPQAFRAPSAPLRAAPPLPTADDDYLKATPPLEITRIDKQAAKRHHGVHGYFTRQVWSVVQRYIETFTRPGDVTLDPFGGTGVTLIESIILGRKGIHVDINPLSTFLVETLVTSIDLPTLLRSFDNVVKEFTKRRPKTDAEIQDTLKKYPYPSCVALPKTSDVGEVSELFTPKQLAELALLKSLMLTVQDKAARQHMLLCFPGC